MFSEFSWLEATMKSPIFVSLIAFSIVTFGVAIERLYYYWKRHGNADQTTQKILAQVREGHIDQAEWTCRNTSHPIGAVAEQLFVGDADVASTDERLYVALSQQKLLLEKNLNVLGTMAAIAPLVGLLGTVWGIMRAFHDMAHVGSAAPSVVAAGVAEALVTTAAGLVIAVPALMLYNHFTRRLNVMLTMSENNTRLIRAAIAEQADDGSVKPYGRRASDNAGRRGRTERQTPEPAEPATVG
jgi:biopolymer transport protein ExbB